MVNMVTTGPRDCEPSDNFSNIIFHLKLIFGPGLLVVEGGADGSDAYVRESCQSHGVNHRTEPAKWSGPCDTPRWCPPRHRKPRRGGGTYCPAAGIRRNQLMLDRYDPLAVLALTNRPVERTRGTKDMVKRASAEGRCVVEIDVTKRMDDCIAELSIGLAEVI